MGTDKDRMFLFSQFAAGLRAGMSPHDFLGGVAARTGGIFRDSLQKMSEAAREGIPMSNVMERYPDLYPPHVPAMVRAGEVGGFLPEACETIAQQAEQSYKFNRFFVWVWFVLVNFVLSIPGVLWIRAVGNASLDENVRTGGEGGTQGSLMFFIHAMWKLFVWPYGPITLGTYLVLWLAWKFYLGSHTRALRHEVGLKWPAFGARARAENLTIFAWSMGKLTKAGLPHAQAWELASRAVPNQAVSKRLINLGNAVGRERPISQAFQDSRLFPPEYGSVAATGEVTGDMSSAMDQLASMSRSDFEGASNMAKIRGAGWGLLGCLVTSAFMMGVIFYWYLHEVPDKILGDDNPLK
jgi:type II secretory pathway component PulF